MFIKLGIPLFTKTIKLKLLKDWVRPYNGDQHENPNIYIKANKAIQEKQKMICNIFDVFEDVPVYCCLWRWFGFTNFDKKHYL